MRLYDTARQAVVDFTPDPTVKMYTCGITPYDSAHIGHVMVYLTYDVLQRRLRDMGHETQCVRNVTDVDDDILRKAREVGVYYLDLAAEEMAKFDAAMTALDMLPSFSEPRATSRDPRHPRLHRHGARLRPRLSGGRRRVLLGWQLAKFGEISHYSREQMLEYARERGGNVDDPNKKDPLDFVLWQPSAEDEPWWESLWGRGRPGWHIECSALAMRELGETIDLHGGGGDLDLSRTTSARPRSPKPPPGRRS